MSFRRRRFSLLFSLLIFTCIVGGCFGGDYGRLGEEAEEAVDSASSSAAAVAEDGGTRTGKAFSDTFPNLSAPTSMSVDTASSSQPKNFSIVCCMGGVPELAHPDLLHNFTLHSASYVIEDRGIGLSVSDLASQNCRLFHGSVRLPRPPGPLSTRLELSYSSQIVCKCPEYGMGRVLDRNCRRLPSCLNNGIHSLMDPRRCFCLDPFFGERCEKICDQGRRMKGPDGRDRCSCVPFYRGEECREAICLNGGRLSAAGHCECAAYFLGFHCEIDANRTIPSRAHEFGTSRFQRFGGGDNGNEFFSRDVSGTVFSLVMIVVLVLSMYLLMKHRMQVQSRYLSSRRADLLGACNFPNSAGNHHFLPAAPGSARRVELLPVGNDAANHAINSAATLSSRTFPAFARSLAPFLLSGADAGPPPYAPPGQRARRPRSEALPPLPSYEDATKLPALVPVVVSAEHAEEEPAEGLSPGQRRALNRTAEEGTEVAGREGVQREATRHGVAERVPEAAQEPEQQQQQQQRRGER